MLSLIVAASLNDAIGCDNKLPWHLPVDLLRFKHLTLGHHIIMGRKTYESIGRPLPGRTSVVLTRSSSYRLSGIIIANSIPAVRYIVSGDTEPFVIGGAEIYRQFLPVVKRVYLTRVHVWPACGDVFFPKLHPWEWKRLRIEHHEPSDKNKMGCDFEVYERHNPGW